MQVEHHQKAGHPPVQAYRVPTSITDNILGHCRPHPHLPPGMSSSVQISPIIAPHHNSTEDSQRRGLPTAPAYQTLASTALGPALGPSQQNTDMHQAGACPRLRLTKHHCCAMGRGLPKAQTPRPPHLLLGPNPTNSTIFGSCASAMGIKSEV